MNASADSAGNGPPEAASVTPVFIASTMRSGSTLLKALLAQAPDVSHLPEYNFQKLHRQKDIARCIRRLSDKPIVVLKRPAWYHELGSYPRLPIAEPSLRLLVLVRDAYATVRSLRKMSFGSWAKSFAPYTNRWLVDQYWSRIGERLMDVHQQLGERAFLIRYEDLVANPVRWTRELFAFIGAQQQEGVDCYEPPEAKGWKWGRDDGSEKIRSLQVVPPPAEEYRDWRLLETIRNSKRANRVRSRMGYPPLPDANRDASVT